MTYKGPASAAVALIVMDVFICSRGLIEQCAHIAQVADRNAHFANLAAGKGMVTVIPRLCRQVEGHTGPSDLAKFAR